MIGVYLLMKRICSYLVVCLGFLILLTYSGNMVAFAEKLTVKEATEIALRENPTLKNYQRELQKSEIALKKYQDIFYPQIKVTGDTGWSYLLENDTGDFHLQVKPSVHWQLTPETKVNILLSKSVDSSIPAKNDLTIVHRVFGGERLWETGLSGEQFSVLSSEVELQKKQISIIYQVVKDYYDIIKTMKVIELQKEALRRSEDHLAEVTAFYEAGQVSKLDLLNAEVQINQDKSALDKVENALFIKKMQFEMLLGVDLRKDQSFVSEIELTPLMLTKEEAIKRAEANSLELRLLGEQLDLLKEKHQQLLSSKDPQVSVKGNYNWEDKIDQGATIIALEVSYHLTADQQIKYDLQQNLLEQEKIVAQMQMEKDRLRMDVTTKYSLLAEHSADIQLQKDLIKKYSDNLEISKVRYQSGLTNGGEVLDSQISLFKVEKTYYERRVDYQLNVVELLLLLGEQF